MREREKPKVYDELVCDIVERIDSGELRPGHWLPSEMVLAKKYSIGRPSVRSALDELRKRDLVEKLPGKGSRIKSSSKPAYPGKQNRIIGVTVPEWADLQKESSFLSGVHAGILQAARNFGCRVELIPDLSLLQTAAAELSGMICISYKDADIARLLSLPARQLPKVMINRLCVADEINYVSIDHREWTRRAIEYLLQLGHRQIGFLASYWNEQYMRSRLQGCRDAFAKFGLTWPEEFLIPVDSADSVRGALDAFLDIHQPSALFLGGGHCSDAALGFLCQRGVRIPEDLSVISFDDFRLALQPLIPALTFVRQPLLELGRRAVSIIERIERLGITEPIHELLPAELVVRESCAPLRETEHVAVGD